MEITVGKLYNVILKQVFVGTEVYIIFNSFHARIHITKDEANKLLDTINNLGINTHDPLLASVKKIIVVNYNSDEIEELSSFLYDSKRLGDKKLRTISIVFSLLALPDTLFKVSDYAFSSICNENS